MRNRTYPKENQKKLNEIIRELKAEVKQLSKERDFYKKEVENIMKPIRDRKAQVKVQTHEEWTKDFIKRWKRDVLGEKT